MKTLYKTRISNLPKLDPCLSLSKKIIDEYKTNFTPTIFQNEKHNSRQNLTSMHQCQPIKSTQPQILPNNRHERRTTSAQWNSRLVLTHSSLIYVADKRYLFAPLPTYKWTMPSQTHNTRVSRKTYTQPSSRLEMCHVITCIDKRLFSHKYDSMHKGRKVFKACNVRLR